MEAPLLMNGLRRYKTVEQEPEYGRELTASDWETWAIVRRSVVVFWNSKSTTDQAIVFIAVRLGRS